jgi:hypothetical protein
MSSPTSPFMAVPLAGKPEPFPVSPRLDPPDLPDLSATTPDLSPVPPDLSPVAPDLSPVGLGDARRRPLDVAQCSLCGIAMPLGLLVPDGGAACADVRWYCKDAKSCTERWTTARPPARPERAQSVA